MNDRTLARLLTAEIDDSVLSVRGGQPIMLDAFRERVAIAAGQLRGKTTAILLCRDSYSFGIGLFGCLHAGVRVLLPHHISQISGRDDFLIDDAWIDSLNGAGLSLSHLDPACSFIEVFTSGSTGAPQKIIKSLEQFEIEIALLEKIWGADMGDGIVHATVSHQHIFGLTFKVLWPLAAGRAFAAETPMLWEDVRATLTPRAILISSPAHLSRLDGLARLAADMKLRAIFTAGAPLAQADAERAGAILGCTPYEIFGSTETGAIATRLPTIEDFWHPLPGIDIRSSEDRLLQLRSPYAGNTWMETKDRVEMTGGGFHFLGRADDIVKIEGKRVSLASVENSLVALTEIEEAATVMLPGLSGSLAAAVVLSSAGKAALTALGDFRFNRQLRQHLLQSEDAAAIPRRWRFVEHLPAQAMGKRRAADIIALFTETS